MIASRLRSAALALCAALACAAASVAAADEPFYKGKRLTLLVNYAAGGPTDVEARLLPGTCPSTSMASRISSCRTWKAAAA